MKKNKSQFYAKSIYSIDLAFYIKERVKYVIIDIDNTLDPYSSISPSLKAHKLINKLMKIGLKVILISNNRLKKVSSYAKDLNVPYLASSHKRAGNKIKNYLEQNGIKVSDCLFIGDQIFTDLAYINRLGGKGVLVDPLSNEDHIVTKIFRPLDNYLRNKWKNEGRLGQKCPEREVV